MPTDDLSEAKRLALPYVIDVEHQAECAPRRARLAALIARLVSGASRFTESERADLAYRTRREIEITRRGNAPGDNG